MGWFSRRNKEIKESQVYTAVFSSGQKGTQNPDVSFEKLSKESYMRNVVAFRCIDLIAKSVAGVKWALFKMDAEGNEERIGSHPILTVINRPNIRESFPTLMERAVAYFLISGNTYMEKFALSAGVNSGAARELYVHRPDRITVVRQGLDVIQYQYKYGSETVTWDVDRVTGKCNLLHIKTFAPVDDFYGWGITMSAASELDNSNDSSTWNRSMFKNGARPGTLITMSKKLSPEQYERFKEQIEQKYSGVENAGKTLVMDNVDSSKGDINITPWGWSPREMDFNESENKMARRIAFAYGVPPQMIGIPGDNTYSNYKEARESFWEDTVSWYLNLFAGELNHWLLEGQDVYLKPMLDDSPAMEATKSKRLDVAQKSDFLTINEKRTLAGFPPIDGGDVLLVSSSMMPVIGCDAESWLDNSKQDEAEQAAKSILEKDGDVGPYDDYEGVGK